MNYRQKLIHEAVEELRSEDPALLAHVTDITANWKRNAHDSEFWLVYDGVMYLVRSAGFRYPSNWGIFFHGRKESLEKNADIRRSAREHIKKDILATIRYAEQTSSDRCGQHHLYPGLA